MNLNVRNFSYFLKFAKNGGVIRFVNINYDTSQKYFSSYTTWIVKPILLCCDTSPL